MLSLVTHVSKIRTKLIKWRIEKKVEEYLKNDYYRFRNKKVHEKKF